MKNSLWTVIVIVVGIVGFLMGYAVSAYTGLKNIAQAQAQEKAQHGTSAGAGYGTQAAPAAAPAPAGYGQPAAPKAEAGGYGH
jgi:hypothetical protein